MNGKFNFKTFSLNGLVNQRVLSLTINYKICWREFCVLESSRVNFGPLGCWCAESSHRWLGSFKHLFGTREICWNLKALEGWIELKFVMQEHGGGRTACTFMYFVEWYKRKAGCLPKRNRASNDCVLPFCFTWWLKYYCLILVPYKYWLFPFHLILRSWMWRSLQGC